MLRAITFEQGIRKNKRVLFWNLYPISFKKRPNNVMSEQFLDFLEMF